MALPDLAVLAAAITDALRLDAEKPALERLSLRLKEARIAADAAREIAELVPRVAIRQKNERGARAGAIHVLKQGWVLRHAHHQEATTPRRAEKEEQRHRERAGMLADPIAS